MKDTVKAVINWQYFMYNHKHDWIKECFPSNEHIHTKYKHYCEKYGNSTDGMFHFFMELDTENQKKMVEYVNTNYVSFQKFKVS